MKPDNPPSRFSELLKKSATEELSAQEQQELAKYMAQISVPQQIEVFDKDVNDDTILQHLQEVHQFYKQREVEGKKEGKLIWLGKWTKYAASILLLVTVGTGIYLFTEKEAPKQVVIEQTIPAATKSATLTLADGTVVSLDQLRGEIGSQGSTVIKNTDGHLAYIPAGENQDEIVFNTLTTARAETYSLQLADGSRVWLNAESSVRFPVSFGKTREIEVTGEVYLEVFHDPTRPFIVNTRRTSVQVLGTKFAINAYSNEETIKTTLLEGKVSITTKNGNATLRPGQQAQVSENDQLKIVDADETAIAWKNGKFAFNNATISQVLRELQRWYNVDVDFGEDAKGILFHGSFSRDVPLNYLLERMQEMSSLQFKIEGKTIKVFYKSEY
jgi:Fe2+-dicitrate sensor, membrane component